MFPSTMAQFFGVSTSSTFWVILIYVIVLGSFLIAFGKLAQQKGYKKVFLTKKDQLKPKEVECTTTMQNK